MEKTDKTEFVFYYESRQNPNGDPGFDNQPRQLPDGSIMVTDVRLKRTIRDYAKTHYDKTLFVDFSENGAAVKANKRAESIIGELSAEKMPNLLIKTFDVPLFGALVPIKSGDEKGSSFKVTGPVQFGLGKSVNQVEIINPLISSHFVGKGKGGEEHGTFGKFYSVVYALIKFQGVINPSNLFEFFENDAVMSNFNESEKLLFDCMWDGTTSLVTRSKYPQRSIFYFEVIYDNTMYNDLPNLITEKESLKGNIAQLDPDGFDFTRLLEALKMRKGKVKGIRVASCSELLPFKKKLVEGIKKLGISVEELR